MKTTLCFLGRAKFSIFPRLAHIVQQLARDTTAVHPCRTPLPYSHMVRRPPPPRLCRCPGQAPFSLPRAAVTAPPPSAPCGLASSPGRTPLKSLSCHFEKGPLCHRRSLSPFPLPPAPWAALCPSLLASCLGSASRARRRAASNSASLVSSPCAPPFFNPSGPTPTPLPPLAVGAHRSYRRPPEHCRR
jgi:hypothetical protein